MWQIKGTTWNDDVVIPISAEEKDSVITRLHHRIIATEMQHDVKLT